MDVVWIGTDLHHEAPKLKKHYQNVALTQLETEALCDDDGGIKKYTEAARNPKNGGRYENPQKHNQE